MTELMEQKFNKEIQNNIKQLIDEKKLTLSVIAKGVNKSPSTLSLYISGKYSGDVSTLEEDLKNYLALFKKKEQTENKTLNFVETTTSKRLFHAANMCHLRGKMGVCFGAPGIGKTTAINEYKKVTSGVVVVDPFEGASVKEVLMQIGNQLKVAYYHGLAMDDFAEYIIKKLEKNKGLIIFDEAENLKIGIFKVIRKIHDRTKNSCGILFVGTDELKALLLKVKSGFPYISSRIGYLEKLDALKMQDVEKLVYQYFPTCNDNLMKYIAISTNYNARSIQNLLDLCFDFVQSEKIELDIDVIDAAREKLLI